MQWWLYLRHNKDRESKRKRSKRKKGGMEKGWLTGDIVFSRRFSIEAVEVGVPVAL